MISCLLNTFIVCTLFADLLERRFPEQTRTIATDLTFNVLYLFSKTQIYFTKVIKNINNFLKSHPTIKKELSTNTEFFKNGKILNTDTSSKHDFALFSWVEHDTPCVNKKIVYDVNEVNDQITLSEHSDIKFMLVEITVGENQTYKVDLKTRDYNFYLVGNKFTKEFFIYYLINHLNIDKTDLNESNFSIKIIDHNVNIFHMDFTDKNENFVLTKMDYLLN